MGNILIMNPAEWTSIVTFIHEPLSSNPGKNLVYKTCQEIKLQAKALGSKILLQMVE